jgi:transposase-like protein
MSDQDRNVAPTRDEAAARTTATHRPKPGNGAAVHTEMHRFQDSTARGQANESPSDTATAQPQVKGTDPFTRTAPLHQRVPHERAADVAAVHTNPHRLKSSIEPYRPSHRDANPLMPDIRRELEDPQDLSETQQKAIELLLAGKSYTQIAEQLGIDRSTLWRWRNGDGGFRRALETARETAFRDADSRLRELVPRALQVLEDRLADSDYQAAIRVLNLARIDGKNAAWSFQSRNARLERMGGRSLIE